MSETALLIIDVQSGMFRPNAPVYEGEELLANLHMLIDSARVAEVPVVYIQHNGGPAHPLAIGTADWEIHPAIEPHPHDIVVQKHTPDSFHETDLHIKLAARGIRRLVICGIQTDVCVDTTCRRAFSLGYDVTLAADAHSTWANAELGLHAEQIIGHHNSILRWFAEVTPASEIDFM
jgi:nicotinamidase-related amidase